MKCFFILNLISVFHRCFIYTELFSLSWTLLRIKLYMNLYIAPFFTKWEVGGITTNYTSKRLNENGRCYLKLKVITYTFITIIRVVFKKVVVFIRLWVVGLYIINECVNYDDERLIWETAGLKVLSCPSYWFMRTQLWWSMFIYNRFICCNKRWSRLILFVISQHIIWLLWLNFTAVIAMF